MGCGGWLTPPLALDGEFTETTPQFALRTPSDTSTTGLRVETLQMALLLVPSDVFAHRAPPHRESNVRSLAGREQLSQRHPQAMLPLDLSRRGIVEHHDLHSV